LAALEPRAGLSLQKYSQQVLAARKKQPLAPTTAKNVRSPITVMRQVAKGRNPVRYDGARPSWKQEPAAIAALSSMNSMECPRVDTEDERSLDQSKTGAKAVDPAKSEQIKPIKRNTNLRPGGAKNKAALQSKSRAHSTEARTQSSGVRGLQLTKDSFGQIQVASTSKLAGAALRKPRSEKGDSEPQKGVTKTTATPLLSF
jgi:hypothetical protein